MNPGSESWEQAQGAGPQFQVRCARELFEALESPDGTIRVAALHAVQNAPATALSFGRHNKRDLVDVLLSQAEGLRGELEWLDWIGALAAFHDPRVFRLFTSLITTETHTELLFALANYLRSESLDSIRVELGAALMQNECVARARAVGSILTEYPPRSAVEALRIGLIAPGDETSLPVFTASVDEWLSELAGPFQMEARLELKRQGGATLTALVGHWGELSDTSRKWLLAWAAETDPDVVLDRVREALTGRSDDLTLPALEAAVKLKEFPDDFESLITPLFGHGDELIRRAAVMACRSAFDWRRFFENEPSSLVRQAAIARLVDQKGDDAIPFALEQLANPDWGIRAAAAEGLLSLGEPGVRAALTLLPEASEPVRVAIGRIVADWDDEELIEEFIQCCPQLEGDENAT